MSFATLRRLNDGSTQRGDFHVLAVVRRGQGRVSVDFTAHPLAPRSVVWIRPGVVHRWDDLGDLTGDLVLFTPTAPAITGNSTLVTAPSWTVNDHAWPLLRAALDHLRLETASPAGEIPGLLLSALLLRLDPPAAGPQPAADAFRRFRDAVEEDFHVHHDVAHYAQRLGYSTRTLSRSAQAATGRTAKDLLVERIVLEAKRLLAHDRLTPARCGQHLGFPDPANFSAFFLRETGTRPGAWQAANA
ncbi:transcriptional regulator [Winogradskya humida]|uniref:Transcriptional regulator n=2 Tax=Winogradskya humida TaxID=113566 RepID=A0ABQ4A6V5_9ACTN|nr:transcriptional regulator [Actinoplanes humidus]